MAIELQVTSVTALVTSASPIQCWRAGSRSRRREPRCSRLEERKHAVAAKTYVPLFVTASGHRLHATAFKRTLAWSTVGEGRRIHDLRHTAACLWLSLGVDVVTVQAWMGHVSIATTNLYLHHLGTSADKAGLDRLNRRGHAGGTQREAELE